VDRKQVSSSLVASVGYDTDEEVLEIELQDGKVYQYRDVPEETCPHRVALLLRAGVIEGGDGENISATTFVRSVTMTDGHCTVCGETYTKRGMTRHLTSCLSDLPATNEPSLVHVRIGASKRSDYWLHLAVEQTTTLDTLDAFLRGLWLECCGHMSAFTIGEIEYTPYSEDESMSMFGVERRSMDVSLATVLDADAAEKNQEFTHEYDFGTTTELTVRVVDIGYWDLATTDFVAGSEAVPDNDGIYLLARNEPPTIECGECGAPAAKVCQSCLFEIGPDAWLCGGCADVHTAECDHPSFLPRVNSPRTGVCGYTG